MPTLRLLTAISPTVPPSGRLPLPAPIADTPTQAGGGANLVAGLPQPPPRVAQPKLVIGCAGVTCVLPLGPNDSNHGGMGWQWEQMSRAGRKPLVTPGGQRLRTLEFPSLFVGYTSYATSIDPVLLLLERISNLRARCSISYSRPERGVWVLDELSYSITARQPGTNAATRANVDLKFLEYVPPIVPIGPARPSSTAAAASAARPTATTAAATVNRYVTVTAGTSLYALAARYYGNGELWPRIADANHISDPAKLTVGQRLRIP